MTTAPTQLPTAPVRLRRGPLLVALVLVLAGITVAVVASRIQDDSSSTATPVQGSGVPASERRDLAGFTSVDLAGANIVTIRVGGRQSVIVEGDDNLLDHVTTRVHDGELAIANRGSYESITPMRVELTVPALVSVTLSGTGDVRVDDIDADHFWVRVPGSGFVAVSGATERLDADLSGAGHVRLGDLVAADVNATVAGTGQLEVQATRSLDASVSGVGAIVYSGDPATVTQAVTGTGTISRR